MEEAIIHGAAEIIPVEEMAQEMAAEIIPEVAMAHGVAVMALSHAWLDLLRFPIRHL
jgi:hypothetical protein